MRLFLIVFALLLCPVFADVYDAKVADFAGQLPKLEDVSCKFRQEKQLKNIAKPVVSGGNFKFIKNKGVFFETTYPVQSSTSFANKDYRQINEIITAISNKKYTKLENSFNFYFKKQQENWTLGLKPKSGEDVAKFINSITIDGQKNIKRIVIILKNGNKTTLWFEE